MTGASPNIAPSVPAFRGPGSPAQAERTPIGARKALENERSVGGGAPASPNGASTRQAAGGLAVGATAPTFALEDLQGETLTLDSLRQAGKPVMLLFTDPRCGPSNALLPEVGRWQEEYAIRLSIALVSRGDLEDAIASPMAGGAESIRPFVAQAVAALANVPLLPRAPAPRAAQEGQPCPNCKVRGRRVGSFDTTSDTTQSATRRNV